MDGCQDGQIEDYYRPIQLGGQTDKWINNYMDGSFEGWVDLWIGGLIGGQLKNTDLCGERSRICIAIDADFFQQSFVL